MVVAAFAEQSVSDHMMNVEHVEHGIGVLQQLVLHEARIGMATHLGKTGGEDDDLEYLAHLLEEMIHSGPFHHVDVMCLRFDFDGDDIVCGWQHLRPL